MCSGVDEPCPVENDTEAELSNEKVCDREALAPGQHRNDRRENEAAEKDERQVVPAEKRQVHN